MKDYHVHTEFSADCDTPMEAIVEAAIDQGVTELCFTDHIDYDYNCPGLIFEFQPRAYFESIDRLQEKYAGRIELLKGVEIGLQPHVLDQCQRLMDEHSFDFALGSIHACDQKDLHYGEFFEGRTAEDAIRYYLEDYIKMLRRFDRFSVLGHLDLPKRYSEGIRQLDFKVYKDQIGELLELAISREVGIEINTSGLRQDAKAQFPDWQIIDLYLELGGKVITLGSDSHSTDKLCFEFDGIMEKLKARGIERTASFKKMQSIL